MTEAGNRHTPPTAKPTSTPGEQHTQGLRVLARMIARAHLRTVKLEQERHRHQGKGGLA
ncbi:hypothetical protein ACFLVD_01105 [Chloroflexota bacterium]